MCASEGRPGRYSLPGRGTWPSGGGRLGSGVLLVFALGEEGAVEADVADVNH